MNVTLKIFLYFLVVSIGFSSYTLSAQAKKNKNVLTELNNLYLTNKPKNILSLTEKTLQDLKSTTPKDSLFFAKLYLYKFIGLHKTNKSINNVSSIDKGISYCPNSYVGDSLKAVFYNKKAYLENELSNSFKSYKSILKSLRILEKLPNPNPGYLMGAYLLISNQNAYFGNFDLAKQYMRLAEDVYAKNKKEIDGNTLILNGNSHRLGVIAKYRKIYMLWKLSKNSKDSLTLLKTMKSLEQMHNQPNFSKEERVYYSTSLNHVGDWFVSYKHDSLTNFKDVKTGLKYLFKALDLVENKKYPGTPWAIKYNIAKGFTRGNLLEKADSTIAVLFKGISKTDGRIPFFLAQKGLIKAKKHQKDSALFYFNKSIDKIHQNKDTLKTDYSNFKPSKSYNHTRLLLRISEELNNYYPKDSVVQTKITKLYYLALQQFENSYLDVNFNGKQNEQLRKIMQGILKRRKTGFLNPNLPDKKLLDKFEIFKNQMAWKKFYENRYTNTLPELDSLKNRKLELAKLLNKTKISNQTLKTDSIQNEIYKLESFKKEQYPQLALLSNYNFSIEKLQKELNTKSLILKYIVLESEIAIYEISKTDFKVRVLPWTHKEENLLHNFIKKTTNRNYNIELAKQLAQILIPPLDKKTTNLIINPDGLLFNLPFETLPINGKFATEIYNFRYTSNLGFINYKPYKNSVSKNIHIYAPHYNDSNTTSSLRDNTYFLKGANKEAISISKMFPSKLFSGNNLTKSAFLKTAEKGKVLHLAMHADVNKQYPEFSRLLFSNNIEREEDHLYLEELYGLSLNAELAILSACNTGNGLEKNGNLQSFQRAFTFAGVPATIASLWEVPDASTEQIMVFFYENLKKGQTKSEALKNAKLTFKEKNKHNKLSEPYFWAGFVVYGIDTPIITKPSYLLLHCSLLIVIIILLTFLVKKNSLL